MTLTQELAQALRRAARQFRHYEFLHAQKHTEDAVVKSQTNAAFAELCETALARYDAEPPTTSELSKSDKLVVPPTSRGSEGDLLSRLTFDGEIVWDGDTSRGTAERFVEWLFRQKEMRAAPTPAQPSEGSLLKALQETPGKNWLAQNLPDGSMQRLDELYRAFARRVMGRARQFDAESIAAKIHAASCADSGTK